jgi:transmembrane sensor
MLSPVAAQALHPAPVSAAAVRRRAAGTVIGTAIGRRAFIGGAAAATACAAGYALIQPPLGLWPSLAELRADVRTGIGEQRRIALAAGIAVELNTRSSLVMHQPVGSDVGGNRLIELVSGEAVIAAVPAAGVSCTVLAGGGRVLARAAKVDVRYDGAAVRVACIDGSVRVEHGGQAVTLAAQQQVAYDARGISGTGFVDSGILTAWQRGLLVFRQAPLAQVIDEVNRYRPGRILLLDRALGGRLIDASFHLDRLDGVVVYLEQAFGARITALPGGIVVVG